MKKITLLFVLLAMSFGYSQELVTNGDFQTGTASPWYGNAANVVDLGGGTFVNQAEVITAGTAFSVNLSQDITLENGKTYELTFEAYTDATTSSRTMVVGLGQNNAPWSALTQTPVLTATSQPFTYQFTINYGDTVGDRVLFDMGAETGFVFLDNVSVIEIVNTCTNGVQDIDEDGVDCGGVCPNACPVPPTSAAPTPPARPVADVVSVVSPAYADETVSGVNVFAGATIENYTVTTPDDTRRLTTPAPGGGVQFEYFFGNGTGLDLTTFTTLHIDVWLEDAGAAGSVLTIQLQNFDSGTGAFQHNIFTNIDVNTSGAGAWVGGDIDLSAFTNSGLAKDNIQNVQLIAQGPAFGPTYFTNLYFHKGTVLGTEEFELAKFNAYPNPTDNVWNIKAQQTIESVSVFDVLGKQVMIVKPNDTEVELNASTLPKGLYFAKMTTEFGSNTIKLIKN